MKHGFLTACERRIHYLEAGDPAAPPVFCWHGIARTADVLRPLALALAEDYRVICPDVIGRGLSQWSDDPKREYCLDFYAAIARDLVEAFGFASLRWVGISMGGAIGIRAAGGLLRGRISHLVLDDMGPSLEPAAVLAIRDAIESGARHRFNSLEEFEAYQRAFYASGGPLPEAAWLGLALGSVRRSDDGAYAEHYDPRIAEQFLHHPYDWDQWPSYDAVTARTLLIRGSLSPLLSAEVAHRMTGRGPRCTLVEVEGVGHAPQLIRVDEIALVREFLAKGAASSVSIPA